MTYAKYISEFAVNFNVPSTLDIEGVHYQGDLTTRPDLLSTVNFFPLENDPEPPSDLSTGYHYEDRYRFDDEQNIIFCYQVVVKDEPLNRSISKRKLMNNLKQLGRWDAVKNFMVTKNYWEDWETSTTLDEQEELMQTAIMALKSALGFSDEDIENLIENSVADY